MRRGSTLSTLAAIATVLVAGLAISPAAVAQRGGGGGRGGFGGGPGGFGGGPGGIGMFGGGPMGMRDPMRSAESTLLIRDDVQHELMLDGRQQQQVADAVKQTQQDAATKTRAAMQTARQKMQSSGQNFQTMTPEERQAAMQQMQKERQDAVAGITEEQNKTLEALLSPSQVARLRQLDLQWRTALALNDPKLAAKVEMTPDQAQQVSAAYQEYLTAQRQAMSGIGGPRRNRGARGGNNANGNANGQGNAGANSNGQDTTQANGQDPNAQPAPPDPQAIQQRMVQAMKDIAAARKAGADKVVAVLSPEQKAQWMKMTGRTFLFKPDAPPTPPAPSAAPGN